MADKITVVGLSEDEQTTLDALYKQLKDRTPRNLLRASYYDGKRAIRQVGSVIPPQYYRLGIVLGWSAKAVDALADRCNLERFTWPQGDLEELGYSSLFKDNDLGIELSRGIVSSLIHGVSFLITTKGGDGEPGSLVHVKDALNATGSWNDRLHRLDALLSILDRDDDGNPLALALYLPGETITCSKYRGRWVVLDRQEHPWGVPADPLVFRPQRQFGSSRISRTVMSLHDSALRALIRMEGHMDVYSFPEMWLLGADESLFKNADGTQRAAWQVMLGRLKAIPDDEDADTPRADVKQFSASSPEPHLAQLNALAKMFARETSLPDSSFAITDLANPTNADAIVEGRDDLIALAENATEDWWGPRMANTLQRALAIANGADTVPDEWRSIAPKWRSPIHQSRAAAADAGTKQLATVEWLKETEVGLELLGLDEQQIQRALAEKRRSGGSAALRAIAEAAETGRPLVTVDNPAGG